ncbi:hypothetical protein RHGRI_020632 [Rhododendron griersonianum]|uniref:Uncharacterized protein n=1 Tax=Rhododendron griersonianum TaxID=479676 RepID=A0AAV6JK29_9ERIC|nr:hypothetical protein RHGRI_020632 [Rhododendron griersonianum]
MTVGVSSYSRRSSSFFTATKPLDPLHSRKGKVVTLLDRACTAAKPQGAPRVLPKGWSRHKSLGKSLGGTKACDPYMVAAERWVARGSLAQGATCRATDAPRGKLGFVGQIVNPARTSTRVTCSLASQTVNGRAY